MAVLGAAIASGQAQEKEVHRVVTAINKDNKSVALFDSKVPLKLGGGGRGFRHAVGDTEGAGRFFV